MSFCKMRAFASNVEKNSILAAAIQNHSHCEKHCNKNAKLEYEKERFLLLQSSKGKL